MGWSGSVDLGLRSNLLVAKLCGVWL